MENDFRDRVAIVTGASSGIGRAAAEMLADRGALVAAFARSADKLQALAAAREGRILPVAGDVSDAEAIERLFSETESRFGQCRIVVNAAGMVDPTLFVETEPQRGDRLFAVNARGTFLTMRRALPSMIAAGKGTIVNVASISGVVGPEKFPGSVLYCASKAAVISMTEALAVEVGQHGVRVNCVSPGSVDTPMWAKVSGGAPANMTPEEVAEAILFLLSDRSRPMNGQNLRCW